MKRALIKDLAADTHTSRYLDFDETLFEPVLLAAADELEANDMVLIRSAGRSRAFASAVGPAIRQTPLQPERLLATFAEQVGLHADPQTAARQAWKMNWCSRVPAQSPRSTCS